MFEFFMGWTPFFSESAHETYRKIINWRDQLFFPDEVYISPEAENLIRRYANFFSFLFFPLGEKFFCVCKDN